MIRRRSPVARIGVRAATPAAIMIATYLLFAGHNRPGGGFAAGLVFGAVLTLRSLTGLQRPIRSDVSLGVGTLIVAIVALAPVAFGEVLLDQQVWSAEAPVLGTIKSGTALPFDIGVTLIVVGLINALLDGLASPSGDLHR